MNPTQRFDLDVGVIVLSCDKYSDLWDPFFELFFRNWGDSPFPVYLLSNKKIFSDQRVKTLYSGSDPDWSSSIKICLKQIKHEYVWVIFDDIFLDKSVDWINIKRLVDFLQKNNPSYLRFRPMAKPDHRIDKYFGRYKENTLYRTSLFAIWKRSVLMDALKEGESAWEFEYNSPARVAHLPNFYGVYEDYMSYVHGVVKGLWLRSAVEKIRTLGIAPDLSARAEMSVKEYKAYIWAEKREAIFNKTPSFLRPALLSAKRKIFGNLKQPL